jgi:hypothetical protein
VSYRFRERDCQPDRVLAIAGRATVLVTNADVGAATESLEVVRQIDVDELSEQASRGGLARLRANQRILVAVILITVVFYALPPEARAGHPGRRAAGCGYRGCPRPP